MVLAEHFTCYTVHKTIDVLYEKFLPASLQPELATKSCDSTTWNFFLWGFLKSCVYANKIKIISKIKVEIWLSY